MDRMSYREALGAIDRLRHSLKLHGEQEADLDLLVTTLYRSYKRVRELERGAMDGALRDVRGG